MIDPALRYARKAREFVRAGAADPLEVWIKILDVLAERRELTGRAAAAPCSYAADRDWERRLHEILGAPWPCPATAAFRELWPSVIEPLQAKGLQIGRGAFGGWGDGEPALARIAWCLVQHLRPSQVVETGVARGFTTRFILEALERNGAGHLWSIDLPPQLKPELHGQIGIAVPGTCRQRWTYLKGSSRRRLPGLLSQLGGIDLFIHDSRHSERNVHFELSRAWRALRPGGAVVADDIDLNWGFRSFLEEAGGHPTVICYAEPLQEDPTRFGAQGLIGVVRKA